MTVREFLSKWVDNVSIKIMQIPDTKNKKESKTPIHIQTDNVDVLINSNKDFLDYEINNFQMDNDLLIVVCEEKITKYNPSKKEYKELFICEPLNDEKTGRVI